MLMKIGNERLTHKKHYNKATSIRSGGVHGDDDHHRGKKMLDIHIFILYILIEIEDKTMLEVDDDFVEEVWLVGIVGGGCDEDDCVIM